MIDASSWPRVKEILQAALAHTPEERTACVQGMCGEDAALRQEVESLLAATEQAGDFIERPAFHSPSATAAFPAGWIPDLGRRALEPGQSVGAYAILEFIGAGGMGEVYRARDTTLNRDVALKVRPAAFALDHERFARLRREAQILAALNHPNIASIYGLESSGRIQALVLELAEGPTLAGRIAKGRISISDALSIAKQIADGLEAAHKRGIIHSDLKPANIKLRPDGTVKILDFGLARALDAMDTVSEVSSEAPATTSSHSQAGLIFGTAAYMSPEQARGAAVDKRTDIWAFGCVLYETLTGRPAFRGETVEDILAAVSTQEPDWSLIPHDTPAPIVKLLRRCLEKNADRRLHDIADARIEIEDANVLSAESVPRKRRPAVLVLASLVAVLAVAGWIGSRLPGATRDSSSTVKRFQIGLPQSGQQENALTMPMDLAQLSMAISPDGTRLVHVLERQKVLQLYLREFDSLESKPIPGTEGAYAPFFSPDGRWIAFFANNKLQKVAVSGGEPIELCAVPNGYGGSWGTDGMILFAADEGRRPSMVPETGGVPRAIIRIGQGSFRQPDILPGGKTAIVTNPLMGVGTLSLENGEFRLLVADAGGGQYVPGHLVYARAGVLLAAPFDVDRLALTGPEAVVLESVRTEMEGVSPQPVAVSSRDGHTLVYAQGGAPKNATTPVWVDRRGKVTPLGMPPRTYRTLSLSPDGKMLAVIIADPRLDLWVQDLEHGTLTQRTFDVGPENVTWTPDGQRIVFGSRRNGKRPSFVPRDGIREPEPWVFGSFSPDGQLVATVQGSRDTGLDLWVSPVSGPKSERPFLQTRFTEAGPKFSPDGRWIAYGSDESGQNEIYVRPYPAREGKWRISTGGGIHALWSRDGKELFYRTGSKWMAVPVTLQPDFKAGTPRLLFEGPYALVGSQSYDVSPDGQRFVVLEPVEKALTSATHLNVVLNWSEHVKQAATPASKQVSR